MTIKRLMTWGLFGAVPVIWVQHCPAADQASCAVQQKFEQEKNELREFYTQRMNEVQRIFEEEYTSVKTEGERQLVALEGERDQRISRLIEIFDSTEALIAPYYENWSERHDSMAILFEQERSKLEKKYRKEVSTLEQEIGRQRAALAKDFAKRVNTLGKEYKKQKAKLKDLYANIWSVVTYNAPGN